MVIVVLLSVPGAEVVERFGLFRGRLMESDFSQFVEAQGRGILVSEAYLEQDRAALG